MTDYNETLLQQFVKQGYVENNEMNVYTHTWGIIYDIVGVYTAQTSINQYAYEWL